MKCLILKYYKFYILLINNVIDNYIFDLNLYLNNLIYLVFIFQKMIKIIVNNILLWSIFYKILIILFYI